MDLTESELRLKDDMERQLGFIVNDPNMLDSDGLTPLMLVNLFYNNPINYTKLLIKMGADPNIVHHEFGTALHSAVTPVPHYESAKYLLSVGANPFVKDSDGDTPYDLAEYYDFLLIKELLKDHMIRKIQNEQLRRMTRKRAKTMRRLATAKSMLTKNNSTIGVRNPMSHMDYDTMSYLMSNYLM
jgi:ankyrin repeat protein